MEKINILEKSDLNTSIEEQIKQLFRQLGGDKKQLPLEDVLDKKNNITLVYCMEHNEIIGIASMCHYKVISGSKGWIEDVVVDSKFRGKGIGRKLVTKLIGVGKEKNFTEILLFTEDHRQTAIKLYSDLGFRVRDSRVYTLNLKP